MCSLTGTWANWVYGLFDNHGQKGPNSSKISEKGPIELTSVKMNVQDRDLLSAVFKRLAESSMKQKNYKEAIINYKKFIDLNEAYFSENPDGIILSYHHLGDVYIQCKEFKDAHISYDKALTLARDSNRLELVPKIWISKALAYDVENKIDESNKVIISLIDLFPLETDGIASIIKYAGGLLKKDAQIEKALDILDRLETKSTEILGLNNIKIAHICCMKGKAFQKLNSLEKAKDYYLKSLSILKASADTDFDLNLSILSQLESIYEKMGMQTELKEVKEKYKVIESKKILEKVIQKSV